LNRAGSDRRTRAAPGSEATARVVPDTPKGTILGASVDVTDLRNKSLQVTRFSSMLLFGATTVAAESFAGRPVGGLNW
jgi:hypothetical protein